MSDEITYPPWLPVAVEMIAERLRSPGEIAPELLTTAEAAKLCGMGERSLYRHSRSGAAPSPVKIGGSGTVRYRRAELLEWISAGCPKVNGARHASPIYRGQREPRCGDRKPPGPGAAAD